MVNKRLLILLTLWVCAVPVGAASPADGEAMDKWLALADAAPEAKQPPSPAAEPPATKGPPLPFHSIEGYGGACITPMAYLVNPGPKGQIFGLPAASFTYVNIGQKNVASFVVTETLFRRIELGYAASRFGMGTLPDAVEKATGIRIPHDSLVLHNFNARAQVIEEDSFGLPLPALTAGIHVKYNDAIRSIDNSLGGALTQIGLARSNGIDYTLTASKTVVIGRPFIFTAGLRNSQAAQIGYLGFSDQCATTFEGSVTSLVTDWLAVAYEFRQKANPYDRIDNLIGDEDNWHAINVGWIVNKHMTLCVGWGRLGNMANSSGNGAWAFQLKYEF